MVASEHLPAAGEALTAHWAKDLPDQAAEAAAACEVTIDLDGDKAVCPACAASFQVGLAHCPGCGLRVG